MQQSLCDVREISPRHFTDVFGVFTNGQNSSDCSDDVNKLKRRPKCKTRNKHADESCAQMCDDFYYKATLFTLPMPNPTVVVPSLTDGYPVSRDMDKPELADRETTSVSAQRIESLPRFDILCSSLQSSENVTAHQAAALTRWLSHRGAVKTASSSLMQILMASKCPLVSVICCRMLKQACIMQSMTSCTSLSSFGSSVAVVDVISYVLFLQKEMLKFLETGQFSMNLINTVCLLDCITAVCRNLLAHCSKLRFSSRFHSRWCSSELRWAVLAVVSLANVVSAGVELPSADSRTATRADPSDDVRSVRMHMERVPQIVSTVLSMSVQCEVAQVWNISRVLNEYWHTSDVCQRRLIVESVLVPKLRVELCTMILARHCDVLLRECVASSLSLDDMFSIFVENVIISAITQRMWMEDDSLSVVSHCQEICLILCDAVCSYIQYQKGESAVCLLSNHMPLIF